jgi:two-component system response regulator NreC
LGIRILIADDHGVLRAGLRALLNAEPGMEVVGEAADGHEVMRLLGELCPDVVVLDISMPGPDGVEITQQLKQVSPDVRVLILTVHEDEGLLRAAIRAGASGYILKRAAEAELISAIYAAWRGELYVHPAMTRALLKDLHPMPSITVGGVPPITAGGALTSDAIPVERLTPREGEVLRLIAEGNTNRQIAELLTISVRTAESHRANLMGKLGFNSRVELVRYAKRHGLLE